VGLEGGYGWRSAATQVNFSFQELAIGTSP